MASNLAQGFLLGKPMPEDEMGQILDEQDSTNHAKPNGRTSAAPHASAGRDGDVRNLIIGAPEGIRTPNLLIRSQVLYPLSYGRSGHSKIERPTPFIFACGRTPAEIHPGSDRDIWCPAPQNARAHHNLDQEMRHDRLSA